eukprot:207391_1
MNHSDQYIEKRVLILGSWDVGKSAVFHAICNNEKYDDSHLLESIHVNRSNCVVSILTLLQSSQILYDSYDENKNNDQKLLECMIDLNNNDIIDKIRLVCRYAAETFEDRGLFNWSEIQQLGQAIQFLWNLPQIQLTYKYMYKMKGVVITNIDYFMNKILEIMSTKYTYKTAGLMDISYCKIRTTGLCERSLIHSADNYKEYRFHIFDVGGERNERKKWIQLFGNVSAVIFVCALDQFCLALYTDQSKNAMQDNIQLFDEICNGKWFRPEYTEIVLLLNRCDLFRRALLYSPLSICFGNEYKGKNYCDFYQMMPFVLRCYEIELNMQIPLDVKYIIEMFLDGSEWWLEICYNDAIMFIKEKYIKLNRNAKKHIIVFETVAVDHTEMQNVWLDIKRLVIRRHNIYINSLGSNIVSV